MRARLQKLPREPQAQPQPVPVQAPGPSDEELRRMIEEAAYYRAEKRGFAPGGEEEDWCQAESEILAAVRATETRI
jgi:hypothetical protein